MKNKESGFTLVELLMVVVILGLLSTIAIVGISKVIQRTKKEKYESEKAMLKSSAETFLQTNKSLAPKEIGDYTIVRASKLKENNVLKDDILNEKGENCMSESYVKITKISQTKYSYNTYVYCGDEKPSKENTNNQPVVEVTFSKYEGVSDPYFNYTIKGTENDSSVTIIGYNFSIQVKRPDESSFNEVYNTGTLSGNNRNIITNTIRFKDYIDITGINEIQVVFVVTNSIGEKATIKSHVGKYNDNQKPICLTAKNEATTDDDWINKKSSKNSRTITVPCKDTVGGSGCIRNDFSRTWPDDKNPFGSQYSTITIKDNAGNTEICRVRVNVDLLSPKLDINVKANDSSIKTFSVGGETDGKENSDKLTISQNDYGITKGLDGNMWFNASYSKGVTYEINLTDNLHLTKWTWSVNEPGISYSKYDEKKSNVTSSISTTNTDGSKGTFTSPDLTKEDNGTTSEKITIGFQAEGIRYGELKVYDKAGNVTTVKIYAFIDRTKPTKQKVHLLKWNNNNTTPTSSSDLSTKYTASTWSGKYVYTYPNDSTDSIGLVYYQFTTTGATTNATNSTAKYRNIKANGSSNISWRACDSAYNCTDEISNNVKVDTEKPTCSITKTKTGSTDGVSVSISCNDNYSGVGKCNKDNNATTNLKSSASYKVSDAVGNENTCSVTVTPETQYRKSTRSAKECTKSCCGTYECNCSESCYWSCGQGSCSQNCSSYSSCNTNSSCTRKTSKSCSTCNKTCTSGSCCGYTSWSDWSSWGGSGNNCSSDTCKSESRIIYN